MSVISARERRLQIEASLAHEEKTLAEIKNSMLSANNATQQMSRFVAFFIRNLNRASPIPRTESSYEFILVLNSEKCYQQSEFMMILSYY